MNQRIQKLRKQSVETRTLITPEHAVLITEFYKSHAVELIRTGLRQPSLFNELIARTEHHSF